MTEQIDIKKGLAGVVVDYTAVSSVNQDTNSLLYRGYPVQQLSAQCSFEQVTWLLWYGELPTAAELAAFQATERAGRALQPAIRAVVDSMPTTAHPMDVLRTAVSLIGAQDPTTADTSPEATLDKAVRLFAATPAIVAYDQRRRHGLEPIAPRDDLDYSANFLWMTFGELPSPTAIAAFNVSMIMYAEHSFNASTFAARVVTSTMSDYYSAIVGAIASLKGPLHGGANEAVMHTFDEIGTADRAAAWLDEALAAKRKIMGFGHRVYKHGDSRVPTMKAQLDLLVAETGRKDLGDMYAALESAMVGRKGILPNLDFPSGPVYHILGFDTEIFTPIFVASRITGWTAHIMEQAAANSLIRPLSAYNGVDERHLPA